MFIFLMGVLGRGQRAEQKKTAGDNNQTKQYIIQKTRAQQHTQYKTNRRTDRAEHEGGDNRIEPPVGKGQRLCGRLFDAEFDAAGLGLALGDGQGIALEVGVDPCVTGV